MARGRNIQRRESGLIMREIPRMIGESPILMVERMATVAPIDFRMRI